MKANPLDILNKVQTEGLKQFDNPGLKFDLTSKVINGEVYVDQAIVAGCSGGTFDNITDVADIMNGKSTGSGTFKMSVYPGSQPIYMELVKNGSIEKLMVPLLALGIPGGNAAAIMMSALVLKGVQMGPMLLRQQPEMLGSVFASMFVTNIIMVVIAIGIAKVFSKILNIPYSILGTVIAILAAIGSYALSNNSGDVILMVGAGVFGYMFMKLGFNAAALVLGLVLGGMCESNLRRAIMLDNGNIIAVFTKPITAVLMIACFAMLFYPLIKPYITKKKDKVGA